MKNRADKHIKAFFIGSIICFVVNIIGTLVAKLIIQDNPEAFNNYCSIMLCVLCSIYFIFGIITIIKYYKTFSEDQQKTLEEAKQTLNSEFKPVVLINPTNISKKEFICQAKLDENGKIICKINVDIEMAFDNYEDFLSHFYIPEE